MPTGGMSQTVMSNCGLAFYGDTIYSSLPYFGQVYDALPSASNGLNFKLLSFNYASATNSKGATEILFQVRQDLENLLFKVEIFDNGTSYIYVRSDKRSSISFTGEMDINFSTR